MWRRKSELAMPPKRKKLEFKQMIPNLVTVFVICCGMTAIRYGLAERYGVAIMLLVLAAILDAMDGKIARALDSVTPIGAELDSLADFFNFGIAPGILVYVAIFEGTPYANLGWLSILAVGVCCALRLARFNVADEQPDTHGWRAEYFVGVPAPALGCLVLMPMFFLLLGYEDIRAHPNFIFVYLIVVGLLAVSNLPTLSIKHARINTEYLPYIMLASAAVIISLVVFLWETLIILCFAYLATIPYSVKQYRDQAAAEAAEEANNQPK